MRYLALAMLLVITSTLIIAPFAHAQRWSGEGSRINSQWRGSDEGESDEDAEEDSTSRNGISSDTEEKIDDLDEDPVEKMPIPILLGIARSTITPDFGDPRGGGTREHEGQDILAPEGSYIVSPTKAVVIRTGSGDDAGKYVYTANPGGETFAYMHLDKIAEDLGSGDTLKRGDLIGYVGNTGNASGGPDHLHFEIRDGRKPTDPYPRLTREFTLKERMDAIEEILEDSEDEEDEAEALVRGYRPLFVAAIAQDIDVPEAVADALTDIPVPASGAVSGALTRDLTLGSTGADVSALQTILITQNKGTGAKALAAAGATGYFGTLTQAALIEYQASSGIAPAAGYFGSLTRSALSRLQ